MTEPNQATDERESEFDKWADERAHLPKARSGGDGYNRAIAREAWRAATERAARIAEERANKEASNFKRLALELAAAIRAGEPGGAMTP